MSKENSIDYKPAQTDHACCHISNIIDNPLCFILCVVYFYSLFHIIKIMYLVFRNCLYFCRFFVYL